MFTNLILFTWQLLKLLENAWQILTIYTKKSDKFDFFLCLQRTHLKGKKEMMFLARKKNIFQVDRTKRSA